MKVILLLIAAVSSLYSPSHMRLEKRIVYLFADGKNSKVLLQQQKILHDDRKGIAERDIHVEIHFYTEKNKLLFEKYQALDKPFLFVLIGKDGTEKFRSSKLVSNEELFAIIDKMPMRRSEMRRQ